MSTCNQSDSQQPCESDGSYRLLSSEFACSVVKLVPRTAHARFSVLKRWLCTPEMFLPICMVTSVIAQLVWFIASVGRFRIVPPYMFHSTMMCVLSQAYGKHIHGDNVYTEKQQHMPSTERGVDESCAMHMDWRVALAFARSIASRLCELSIDSCSVCTFKQDASALAATHRRIWEWDVHVGDSVVHVTVDLVVQTGRVILALDIGRAVFKHSASTDGRLFIEEEFPGEIARALRSTVHMVFMLCASVDVCIIPFEAGPHSKLISVRILEGFVQVQPLHLVCASASPELQIATGQCRDGTAEILHSAHSTVYGFVYEAPRVFESAQHIRSFDELSSGLVFLKLRRRHTLLLDDGRDFNLHELLESVLKM